ncbi:MAG: DUF5676 family membrane protein [Lutibacter sp.]|uniref:DUF5676 family membrane protein n=1 Tax=Lutibacter sp. TaxID=1925666 RepID=UPI00299E826D|nr:DUF5676 family membrane protein [Lutibacter sp.]MDX1828851.1 DUF5676 family membrane protein [Lutibacter sp.]
MNKLSAKKMSIAFGLTGVLVYFGCIIFMAILGQQNTVKFFNNFLHGLDTTSIINMNVSITNNLFGVLQTFVLWALIGFSIATLYNILSIKKWKE